MRGGSRGWRSRSHRRLAPLALHEFRLQLALRLLLRALLTESATAGAWPRAGAADRERGSRARCQRNLRDRRRTLSARRHRRHLAACAAAAPTTVLTNGMLLAGRRLETLRSLPSDRVTFQISLDSPTPERHDRIAEKAHGRVRGRGSSARAQRGFGCAWRRPSPPTPRPKSSALFLDAQHIGEENRVIRHIALRGFATDGVALARADLVPEITITAEAFLASGRGRGRRFARHPRHLSARRVLCCGSWRVRAGKRASASLGDDLQLRVTAA